jgi:hypothetical protein
MCRWRRLCASPCAVCSANTALLSARSCADLFAAEHRSWQGSGKTLTNWCPLGDVPASMGPLAILVGSNCYGERRLIEASDLSTGSSNAPLTVDVSDIADKCWWGTANFGVGDVLTFTSLTVHMGLHNQSGEVRLSLDCRAQPLSEQVSARALQPNWVRQTWDEIYEQPGWKDDALKFYWRRLPLVLELASCCVPSLRCTCTCLPPTLSDAIADQR